jgi:hypothetical protein
MQWPIIPNKFQPDDQAWDKNYGNLKVFFVIAATLTIINQVLGMLIVRDGLPAWAMILANPPFGIVYTWTEAHWLKGNYVIDGQIIGEDLITLTQWFAHVAQILLYYGGWVVWQWFRQRQLRGTRASVPD